MVSNFFVYVLQRPIKGYFVYGDYSFRFEPFYVGKGQSNKYYDRIKRSLTGGNPHKTNILRKYDRIEISVLSVKNEDEAVALEKLLIATIGRFDLNKGPLTNKTDGGEGMSGSLALCKKVAQYSRQGILIHFFDSLKDAIKVTGISNISRACSAKMLAGNFFWRKVGDCVEEKIEVSAYFENRMHDGNKLRPVIVYENDRVMRFDSIKSASEYTNVYPSTIVRGCKNCKIYGGFRFEYENK